MAFVLPTIQLSSYLSQVSYRDFDRNLLLCYVREKEQLSREREVLPTSNYRFPFISNHLLFVCINNKNNNNNNNQLATMNKTIMLLRIRIALLSLFIAYIHGRNTYEQKNNPLLRSVISSQSSTSSTSTSTSSYSVVAHNSDDHPAFTMRLQDSDHNNIQNVVIVRINNTEQK